MSAKCYSGQKISLKIRVKCYNARTFQKNLRWAAGNGRPPRSILLKLKDSSSSKQAVNRQKGVPFFATRDGPICATCGIPLSISIPFIWVSRNCGQKLPEVWQSIGLSDLITLLRLRRHLSRMAMPLAKSLTDAV